MNKKNSFEVIQSALKEGIAASMAHEIVFPLSVFLITSLLGGKIIPKFFDIHFLTLIGVSILVGGLIAVILFIFIRFLYKKGIEYIDEVSLPIAISSRHNQIKRLVERIKTGQSGAIIGAFGQERTLILRHIDNDRSKLLFGAKNEILIYSFLDISTLDRECSQAQFWKYVLEPIEDQIAKDSDLFKAYENFKNQDNYFQNHRYLERIVTQLRIENRRLVLLLDRFETLLIRPQLNGEHFLNSLRALASSNAESSLSVILTSNAPVWQLHESTTDLSTTDLSSLSSPHLNFLEHGVITLGVIPETEINKLLNNDRHPFTRNDKHFIKEVSGGHPFLLETAAVILKQTHKDIYGGGSSALVYLLKLIINGLKPSHRNEEEPTEIARKVFTERADTMLTNILKFWSPKLGKALISVAHQSDISGFPIQFINELERQGFIKKVNEQWQVRSSVFADLLKEKDCQQKKQTN